MNDELKQAIAAKLLAMADDELMLGHRGSEWSGHGPILEEDIAFSNIALDEIGHATLWYRALAELTGEDPETHPDRLVFFRGAPEWRSLPLVELPKGDWAFTLTRQYLFDAFELARCEALAGSAFGPIAGAAAKIQKEETYDEHHTRAWTARLGLGTAESNRRMQAALTELWPYALQLFDPIEGEELLVEAGIAPDPAAVREAWEARVRAHLTASDLHPPETPEAVAHGRVNYGPYREPLLADMQEVARLAPGAAW